MYVDNLNVYKVDIPPSCGQFSGDIPAATAAEQSEGWHGAADTCSARSAYVMHLRRCRGEETSGEREYKYQELI